MRRNFRKQRRTRRSRFPDLQNTPVNTIRRVINGTASGSDATNITWTEISSYVTNKESRISSVDVEAINVAANGSIAVVLFDSTGKAITNTRSLKVGSIPVRFKVKMPKSTDFGIPDTATTSAIQVSGTCAFTLIVNIAAKD